MSKEQKKTARMEQRMLAAEKSEDRWHEKWKEQQVQLYAVQTELEEEMSAPEVATDVSRLMELGKEQASITESLEQLYEEWETLC